MATTVEVKLNKTSHQVTFEGGVNELLSTIVKSFGDILTSVEEIGELKVYNDDEEEFIKMETTHGKILNGTRFKFVLKKKVRNKRSALMPCMA